MSAENVAVARRLYQSLAKGDIPAVFACCHAELDFHEPVGFPWGGVFKGHAGLQKFLEAFVKYFPNAGLAIDQYIDGGGDTVVVHGRLQAHGTEWPYLELQKIAGGKIKEIRPYIDTAAVLQTLREKHVL